jgi:hypothetical protein
LRSRSTRRARLLFLAFVSATSVVVGI